LVLLIIKVWLKKCLQDILFEISSIIVYFQEAIQSIY